MSSKLIYKMFCKSWDWNSILIKYSSIMMKNTNTYIKTSTNHFLCVKQWYNIICSLQFAHFGSKVNHCWCIDTSFIYYIKVGKVFEDSIDKSISNLILAKPACIKKSKSASRLPRPKTSQKKSRADQRICMYEANYRVL